MLNFKKTKYSSQLREISLSHTTWPLLIYYNVCSTKCQTIYLQIQIYFGYIENTFKKIGKYLISGWHIISVSP